RPHRATGAARRRRPGRPPPPARAGHHGHARLRRPRARHPGALRPRRGVGVSRARTTLLTGGLFATTVSGWEALVRLLQVPPFILPAPSAVAVALGRGLASGLYVKHLGYTVLETALGFLLGSALGGGLGALVATNRYVEIFLYPYIVMFQSLPKIALAPLTVIWFGLGLLPKVVNARL